MSSPFAEKRPTGKFLELRNLSYIVDATIANERLESLHAVYNADGEKVHNLSESRIEEIHEEINRGKWEPVLG